MSQGSAEHDAHTLPMDGSYESGPKADAARIVSYFLYCCGRRSFQVQRQRTPERTSIRMCMPSDASRSHTTISHCGTASQLARLLTSREMFFTPTRCANSNSHGRPSYIQITIGRRCKNATDHQSPLFPKFFRGRAKRCSVHNPIIKPSGCRGQETVQ